MSKQTEKKTKRSRERKKKRKGNKFYSPDTWNSFISQADHEPNAICPAWKNGKPKIDKHFKARSIVCSNNNNNCITAGAVQLNLTSMSAKKNKMQRQIAVVGVVVAIIWNDTTPTSCCKRNYSLKSKEHALWSKNNRISSRIKLEEGEKFKLHWKLWLIDYCGYLTTNSKVNLKSKWNILSWISQFVVYFLIYQLVYLSTSLFINHLLISLFMYLLVYLFVKSIFYLHKY